MEWNSSLDWACEGRWEGEKRLWSSSNGDERDYSPLESHLSINAPISRLFSVSLLEIEKETGNGRIILMKKICGAGGRWEKGGEMPLLELRPH